MIFFNIKGNSTDTNFNSDTPVYLQLCLILLHFVLTILLFSKSENIKYFPNLIVSESYLLPLFIKPGNLLSQLRSRFSVKLNPLIKIKICDDEKF